MNKSTMFLFCILLKKRNFKRNNTDGKVIEEYQYNKNGSLFLHTRHEYNNGVLSESIYSKPIGKCLDKSIYKYYSYGYEVGHEFYYKKSTLQSKDFQRYDNDGNLLEDVFYNSDGSIKSRFTCKYDKYGNHIEYANYNPDGSIEKKNIMKYNDYGKEIESATYDKNGTLIKKHISEYDSDGNEIFR